MRVHGGEGVVPMQRKSMTGGLKIHQKERSRHCYREISKRIPKDPQDFVFIIILFIKCMYKYIDV